MKHELNAFQVAALLVSASYGIGFLFGSGELAISNGMAGSIYGLATAGGMLLLATFAGRLWRSGRPIWDLFGAAYGPTLKNAVALLSVVWMAGVLAAQIHGGVALLRLLGLFPGASYAGVLAGIFVASRLNLRLASTVFSAFLLASGVVLVYALLSGGGGAIYVQAPARFVADLHTFSTGAIASILIAVVALVCTGADYHQFVLAAQRSRVATWGCLLAGLVLVALSFLPASVVIALQLDGGLSGLADSKQVIPYALTHAASQLGGVGTGSVLLLGLFAAALGSGAAIVRAMAGAISATVGGFSMTSAWLTSASLAIGAVLALRGQGIVATMVSVNVLYIASIGLAFVCLLAGRPLSVRAARSAVLTGFVVSFGVYALSWVGILLPDADLTALCLGALASGLAVGWDFVRGFAGRAQT